MPDYAAEIQIVLNEQGSWAWLVEVRGKAVGFGAASSRRDAIQQATACCDKHQALWRNPSEDTG